MIRYILILFLIFPAANNLFSQNYNYKFDRYTNADGLSSNTVTCITKDKEGFIWIGTIDGLHRFDGNTFKIFHPESKEQTSISDSWINDICDDDEYLWVGTPNGLNRLDKITGKFSRFRYDRDDITSISNDYVTEIYRTKKNEIWIGTEDGLNLLDRSSGKVKRYKHIENDQSSLSHNFIRTLFEDNEGVLWIGTYGGGVNRYDRTNNIFKNNKYDPGNPFSLSNDFIESIIEDSTGNLWIATNGGGVNRFDKKKDEFHRYLYETTNYNSISGNNVKALALSNDKMIWCGINPEGISILDPDKNIFSDLKNNTDDASSFNSVSKIYSDDLGSIWICTSKGLYKYNKYKWKFSHYRNIPGDSTTLNNGDVISICDDINGNVWTATKTGLQILNKSTGRFSKVRILNGHSFFNNMVQYIFRDKKNYMWLSTTEGPLIRYDPETETMDTYFDNNGKGLGSRCIFEDREENLWVGSFTGGEITVFDKNRNFKKKYLDTKNELADFSRSPIYHIFEDSKGFIWIATFEGLVMLDPGSDKLNLFKNDPNDSNSLSDNRVTGVVEDKKGYLWITTYGEGLNRFDPETKNFTHYIEDWLGADIIVEVLQDENGNLWLSHYKGISRFNTDTGSFTNYGVGDGVQGLEFSIGSSYKADDGKMYFGGTNGFNSFYPDSISENKSVPNIVITNFKIFNKEAKLENSVTETKEITISHKENFFSFDFAALDFTNPVKNQYAYILEGVDKDWNYVGKVRTANYTDIAPGEYTFKVKGSNNDGVWNEKGTSLKLIITPPIYKTIWFQGLAGLFLIGIIGYIFKQKLNRIKTDKKTQDDFTKKLLKSQEHERKRIAAELHDSLAQHLLIIKSKAKIIFKKADDQKIKDQLNEISELSSVTLDEVRKISYNLRPYELDRLGLTKTLLSTIENVNSSTDIRFDIEVDDIDKMLEDEIEINIYRIVQEILNNIIKHSNATEVKGSITNTENDILIFISDNGKGFYANKKFLESEEKGFGLKGIAERVKLFGGLFKIHSEEEKGTQIEICIPLKK
ncbi:MAG: two-component regulator propeller domain-containing protein [Ignavibacteria bacterium]